MDEGAWWANRAHTTERLTRTHTQEELNTFLNFQSSLTLPFYSGIIHLSIKGFNSVDGVQLTLMWQLSRIYLMSLKRFC